MHWVARAVLSCAASLLLLLGSAHAQDATRARLLTVPDAQMLSDHFPPVALANAISGRVVLSCAIAVDGSSECSAAEETPAAMGFGAAAEALARDWRFEPGTEGGQPIASVSRIPIEFQNATTEPVPAQEAIVVTASRLPQGMPSSRRSGAFYPIRANQERIEGRVVLVCVNRSNQTLACEIESETPEGWGFGSSAISIMREHQPTDGAVWRIPIEYRLVH